ncbi:TetR family transcriptional regulator [Corynebacterium hylobatis]|uniref:TetR family transcriptional regulator n=1 Tax=Corynebacterium hylobatis TaxID=1859290 RepID=A0A3S0BFE4_9CORY|nr:TetR family transcriptional regulator [Corynebacterium hylobatis]RSZ61924.1 TetR family transcriptional regulator [Corynebacterium hylobatis]
MTPPLAAEQLLLIADQFCRTHQVQIRDFSGLVAAAAVPGARIDGVPVHGDPYAAGEALAVAVTRLEPLSKLNKEFGAACRDIYHRLAS